MPETEQAPAEPAKGEEPQTSEANTEITKEPSKLSKLSIIVLVIGIILCLVGAIELVISLKG